MPIAATLNLHAVAAGIWDVVVVGAGPAGSLAARELARHGKSVLLVDKSAFPRSKVCGGCLNLSALATLASVGLGDLVERCGGIPLNNLRLAVAGAQASVVLSGMALSRTAFDAALVEEAIAAGVQFLPETHVRLTPIVGPTRSLLLRHQGQEVHACGSVVLGADGLGGRLLVGEADHRTVVEVGSRLGAGVIADDPSTYFGPGTIYMACGTGGYVGLVRIEDGRLNLATALDVDFVKRAHGVGNAVCVVLREAGFPLIDRLAELPWHGTPLLTRNASCPANERVFLLGDAASYVEPFSGEGMAWALSAAVNVVPFVLRACEEWDSALIRKWSKRYRQTILRRQWVSRTAAKVLREPMLVRMTVGAMTHFPGLAAPIVRYINHARFW